jgi:Carboxypeptidase regulatory-like domain
MLKLTFFGLLFAFVSQTTWALAGTTGGIGGVITDAKTGAPIAGVHLQLTSPSQAATATTDSRGHYIVLSLPADDYTLTMAKAGYDSRAVSKLTVEADQTQVYDFKLTPALASPPPG